MTSHADTECGCRAKEEAREERGEKEETCMSHVLIFPFRWLIRHGDRNGEHEACPSAVGM